MISGLSASGPTPSSALTHIHGETLIAYLDKTRWFGGKGRPFTVSGVTRLGVLGEPADTGGSPEPDGSVGSGGASESGQADAPGGGGPVVDVLLVELLFADVAVDSPERLEYYQVPLAYYTEAEHRLDRAFVGWWEDPERGWVHAYDALHDRQAMALWLAAFGAAADAPVGVGGLDFERVPGSEVDLEVTGSLFTGEQSNSSVAFGEDSVLKIFRKINPGTNPDITTHDALTRAGSTHVAALYGWVGHTSGETGPLALGMLQQFLRTATDGWDLALTSVRTLLADPIVAARESGGDFAGEAERLGEALREIHEVMRVELPTADLTGFGAAPTPADVAAAMESRLTRALRIAPALTPYAEALRASYARLAALPALAVQQIHGDLHLGQTLRTAVGWKIVDFEGEPAKTLAERLLPDSPWRDVAGMLRSFDYAPHAIEQDDDVDEEQAAPRATACAEWTERNIRHFLTAYAGGELSAEQRLLVDAYVADKAVYETVYETRNRPAWVHIPLAAVARIGALDE